MEDMAITCPFCCGGIFHSRKALAEHLTSYVQILRCYMCQKKFSNINNLIEHLHGQCCAIDTHDKQIKNNTSPLKIGAAKKQNVLIINGSDIPNNTNNSHNNDFIEVPVIDYQPDNIGNNDDEEKVETPQTAEVSTEFIKMHLPEESNISPCVQTEQLKLAEQNAERRYVVVGHDGNPTLLSDSAVITKQNSDGTISLMSIKNEAKPVQEEMSTPPENESEKDSAEEMYSCNTCGVSFTSVLEHIQMYHNDQEVVLEVNSPGEQIENQVDDQTITLEFPSQGDDDNSQNDNMRQVVTESGDIVTDYSAIEVVKDEPLLRKKYPPTLIKEEVVDKIGQVYTRKFVQIDKFWSNANIDVKKETSTATVKEKCKSPRRPVVVKKTKLADGSWSADMYHCVNCDIYTSTLEEYDIHACKLKYSCPHCPVAYGNSKSLCAHMKVHKSSKQLALKASMANANNSVAEVASGPFRCDMCLTVFPSNKSLRLHRRMHDPVKARPIQPPVEHGKSDGIGSTETFHCTECDKWIPVGYKIVHMNYHRSATQFNCDICNRKFLSSDYLAMHMKIHNVDKGTTVKQEKSLPYTCVYCNRQFARPHEKVKHERIHTGEKPHSCEICGKSFRVSYCLTLHMRTHTGIRPYACQHCGKRFKAHSVYNHHLLTHSEVRAYKCTFCPKAFKTSVQLAGHKNSHTKPFSCTECNRPFASLYAVRVHTETHRRQNNLKFSCSLCGASYARTFALKDHMKQAHQREIDSEDNTDPIEKDWNVPSLDGMVSNDMPNEIGELAMNPNESESEMVIGLVHTVDNNDS